MVWVVSAVLIGFHLTALGFAYSAVRNARTPQGSVGWVIFLLAVPYVAVPLFLFLGHWQFPGYVSARRSSRAVVAALASLKRGNPHTPVREEDVALRTGFEKMAAMPIISGNSAKLLVDGDETFGAILEEIATAKSYVLVQFYIIRDDRIGIALQEALLRKASEGCRVCLLYDDIGCHDLPRKYLDDLRAGGVQCSDFHSIHQKHSRFQINFRNHRKIVIVDGQVGFVGGLNVGDEYMGRDAYFGHWRDTHLRLRGPVVSQLQLVFAEDWTWATGEQLSLVWEADRQPQDIDAMIIAPGPADVHETGSLYFCNAIGGARKRIWIASPYFVPDVDVLAALTLASLRGVDVRLLVAGKRDHWVVWLAAFAYFDEMRNAGVEVYRYDNGFMHQKVVLIDDEITSVGTVNLDNRSCRLNFEVTALMFDSGFAKEVECMLEKDFAAGALHTTPLSEAPSRLRRYGAPVARLFAPLL